MFTIFCASKSCRIVMTDNALATIEFWKKITPHLMKGHQKMSKCADSNLYS